MITAINNDTSTTINGGKITTGSISANKIASHSITTTQVSSSIITTSNFSAQSISASRINSGSLTSTSVKIGSWNINGTGILSGTCQLYPTYMGYRQSSSGGWQSVTWYQIGHAVYGGSDKKLKKKIRTLDEKYDAFFDDLKPVTFKWKRKKPDDKDHIGFIAQDIQEAEKDNGLDLDLVYKSENDKYLNLDKREIIALNTWQIQKLKKENQELRKELQEIKDIIKKMKEDR